MDIGQERQRPGDSLRHGLNECRPPVHSALPVERHSFHPVRIFKGHSLHAVVMCQRRPDHRPRVDDVGVGERFCPSREQRVDRPREQNRHHGPRACVVRRRKADEHLLRHLNIVDERFGRRHPRICRE